MTLSVFVIALYIHIYLLSLHFSHHDIVAGQLGLLPGVRVGMETPHNRPRCQRGAGYSGRTEYKYHSVRKQQLRRSQKTIWQRSRRGVGGTHSGARDRLWRWNKKNFYRPHPELWTKHLFLKKDKKKKKKTLCDQWRIHLKRYCCLRWATGAHWSVWVYFNAVCFNDSHLCQQTANTTTLLLLIEVNESHYWLPL